MSFLYFESLCPLESFLIVIFIDVLSVTQNFGQALLFPPCIPDVHRHRNIMMPWNYQLGSTMVLQLFLNVLENYHIVVICMIKKNKCYDHLSYICTLKVVVTYQEIYSLLIFICILIQKTLISSFNKANILYRSRQIWMSKVVINHIRYSYSYKEPKDESTNPIYYPI